MKVKFVTADVCQAGLSVEHLKSLGVLFSPPRKVLVSAIGTDRLGHVGDCEVGREYTVCGIRISNGFPYFFLPRHRANDWGFYPAPCFEVTDARLSSHWRLRTHIWHREGREKLILEFAIPEWFAQSDFHLQLVEQRAREVGVMARAAALMEAEYITAS